MEDPNIIIQTVETFSYWGIFGFSLLANIFVPVPEEFFILALGYVAGTSDTLNLWLTAPLVIIGLLISDCFLFWLARTGNKFIKKIEARFKKNRFMRDEAFVRKHVKKIIFFSRFIIQFRAIGPIMAGGVKTPWKTFIFYNTIALSIYVPLMLLIGKYFADRIDNIINGIFIARNYVLAILVLLLVVWIGYKVKKAFFNHYVFTTDTVDHHPTWFPGLKKKKAPAKKED